MKKWMVAVSVLALVVCGTAMLSYAQGPGPGPHGGFGGPGGPGMGLALRELDLTDAQRAQVKTIMQAQKGTMKALMQQMEQNRIAMLTATANGAYDAAKIQTLATQQAALQAQMIVNREAVQHQIYTTVLTADQQAKAEQMRAQAVTRMTERLQKAASGQDTPPEPPND